MDAVLQVGSHQGGVEGQNHLPQPVGHDACDAAQDAFGFLNNKCTLLPHVELLMNQHTQVLLLRASVNSFSTQPAAVFGIFLIYMHLILLNFMKFTQACLSQGCQEPSGWYSFPLDCQPHHAAGHSWQLLSHHPCHQQRQ